MRISPRKPHDVPYFQALAQRRYPHAIQCLHKALKFLVETVENQSISIEDRLKAASSIPKAVDTISKAAGVYVPQQENPSTRVDSVPLIQILLATPMPQKVIELNPQTNGVHK